MAALQLFYGLSEPAFEPCPLVPDISQLLRQLGLWPVGIDRQLDVAVFLPVKFREALA